MNGVPNVTLILVFVVLVPKFPNIWLRFVLNGNCFFSIIYFQMLCKDSRLIDTFGRKKPGLVPADNISVACWILEDVSKCNRDLVYNSNVTLLMSGKKT